MRREREAYFAGLFDGEGTISACISSARGHRQMGLGVEMANTHRGVIDEIQQCFGGSVTKLGGARLGRNMLWIWRAHGTTAEDFVRVVLPYAVIKRAEMQVFLELRATITSGGRDVAVDWGMREVLMDRLRAARAYRVPA